MCKRLYKSNIRRITQIAKKHPQTFDGFADVFYIKFLHVGFIPRYGDDGDDAHALRNLRVFREAHDVRV